MHTSICDELNVEFPIFAFAHCRDVVVAVSKAGGFGVLGAVGFTPEQLEVAHQYHQRECRRRIQPDRSGRGSVHEGGEVLGGDRALGAP
jgi:hypothetical protein